MFAYIGADHDVEAVSYSLSIDHHLQFDKTEEGTMAMFDEANSSRDRWLNKMSCLMHAPISAEERAKRIKKTNKENFFG